jgi:hypothetical protein
LQCWLPSDDSISKLIILLFLPDATKFNSFTLNCDITVLFTEKTTIHIPHSQT